MDHENFIYDSNACSDGIKQCVCKTPEEQFLAGLRDLCNVYGYTLQGWIDKVESPVADFTIDHGMVYEI